nr:uncharacterized protein LOC105715796 [Aotus nancymaae]
MPAVGPSSTRRRLTLPSSQPQLQEEEGLIPTLQPRTPSSGKTLRLVPGKTSGSTVLHPNQPPSQPSASQPALVPIITLDPQTSNTRNGFCQENVPSELTLLVEQNSSGSPGAALSQRHSSCLWRGPYGKHLKSHQQLVPTCQPSGKETLQPQLSLQMAVALADVLTATS